MKTFVAQCAHGAGWWWAPSANRTDAPTARRGSLVLWEERMRFRWRLAQMAKDNPHLIADIGLTMRQAEAEIAKPFWTR